MKVRSVKQNNEQQVFVVRTWRSLYSFPYGKALPSPSAANPVVDLFVDPELADEGFTYRLASGHEGSVLVDQVLDYNEDPAYLRNVLLYQLTLEAQRQLQETPLSKREIIRRLGTSPAQFYRLIDQTNYSKSIDKVLSLLQVLGCDVELVVHSSNDTQSHGDCGVHVAFG